MEAMSMVRQAHTYLAGAVSGTALIAAAVVAFVLLVSLQALRDWPLAGIAGGSDDSAAVSSGRPAAGAGAAAAGAGAAVAPSPGAAANANAQQRGGRADESRQQLGAGTVGPSPSPASDSPAGEAPASNPADGGGAASPTTQSTSSSSGGGGGGGNGAPVSPPGTGGSGGGGTSGAVTGAVNNTVSGVDQTLGGTGVPKVTEEAVNGVAGPESTVGETVDKVVETVGGLLPGKR
jgi:hypothetical protein